ncbi:MAG: outer membrane protein assembly factor BamE [Alphaproteobacteria bacterium]|nr:outer membrane protein assembly factor BamE [Alphaproteobacteria bacterium]
MSIRKMFFLSAALLCTACSSDLFLEHNGNMPTKEKIAQIHNGQTKEEVMEILGGPSITTGLSDDHWIYMSSTIKRVAFLNPEELDRQILAITFDDNQVSKIEKRTLADGNDLSIDKDVTQATERQQGFFRKYFGGVGSYSPFSGKSNSKQGL